MSIQIRTFRERDLPLIVVLLNAAESVDRIEEGTSIEEQREAFGIPGLEPEANAFVAEDEGGRIVGLATLTLVHETAESGFRTSLNVHPMFRGRGLEDRLLARLEERAQMRIAEARSPNVYLACGGHPGYEERVKAIERSGMKEGRRFWVMLRPIQQELPAPSFPPGLIVRRYQMGEDDAQALDAHNDSFSEHFGHHQNTMEWWRYYVGSVSYRPDLTVLATDPKDNTIAGYCHIVVNEGECQRLGRRRGWIDIIGVRKPYRRRGLGEALILAGMENLRAAGISEAALGCDSENTTGATRLYSRVGFQVQRTWIVSWKYLKVPSKELEQAQMVTNER